MSDLSAQGHVCVHFGLVLLSCVFADLRNRAKVVNVYQGLNGILK